MKMQLKDVMNPPYLALGTQGNKASYAEDVAWKCNEWAQRYKAKSYTIVEHVLSKDPRIPKHAQEGAVVLELFTSASEGQIRVVPSYSRWEPRLFRQEDIGQCAFRDGGLSELHDRI